MKHAIHIVGGGLAGLGLGIGLRQSGVPVILHEAHAYPRHRVCGEFIAGLRPGVLEDLGMEDCLADAGRLSHSVWRLRDEVVYEQQLPKPALAVSRYRLDARLAERFTELGGELRLGQREAFAPGREGWVWAMGRERSASQWIGLKMHCQDLALTSDLELHLGDRAYVGLSRVEDGRVNVCGLFQQRAISAKGRTEQLPAYLEACGLGSLARRIRSARPDPPSAVGVTSLSYAPAKQDGELRLGDQAGLIAPFTGNGMAQALEGAALALAPLIQYHWGAKSWTDAVRVANESQRRAFTTRRRVARRLHPWLLSRRRQKLLAALARARLVPFDLLFRLTH